MRKILRIRLLFAGVIGRRGVFLRHDGLVHKACDARQDDHQNDVEVEDEKRQEADDGHDDFKRPLEDFLAQLYG